MKCIQCGADLLESATFCARCGTPTRATMSFSYLPADAPPWPATVPQSTSLTATAVKEPAQSVATSDVGSAPDTKPRRSIGSIFTGFLLLLLSIVIGVGGTLGILALNGSLASTSTTPRQVVHLATPIPPTTAPTTAGPGTPTVATPTPASPGNVLPTPNSFVAVKIAEVGISLKYPGDWIEDQPQSNANFTAISIHPQQQIGIDFAVQRFSSSGSAQFKSLDDLNHVVLQPAPNDTTIHNYKEIQAANPTPIIAGVQWTEQDATFTNSQNDLFHAVSISVKHNNLYYNISYLAPDVVYNEAMQKYYSQILSSFQFLP